MEILYSSYLPNINKGLEGIKIATAVSTIKINQKKKKKLCTKVDLLLVQNFKIALKSKSFI